MDCGTNYMSSLLEIDVHELSESAGVLVADSLAVPEGF